MVASDRACTPWMLLFLLAAFPAAAGTTATPEPARRPGNLLLVTLDTTRADHLSAYGYSETTSPHIDQLAAAGVLFEQASTQIPLTGPAHASMMTSRHPRAHGAIRNGVPMRADLPTLAEALSRRGYDTAAIVSGWTLRNKLTGLQRGFRRYNDQLEDRYRFVNTQRPADEVSDLAIAWLQEERDGPFFLWIHYFDPHAPYRQHDGLYHPPDPQDGVRTEYGYPRDKIARYDSEIRYVDRHLGRILDELRRQGIESDTLTVVTADHGESFGEHDYVGHGRRVYEPTLRIPLIFRFDGRLPAGIRLTYPAQTIDLMPTVLTLLDVPAPDGMEGRDLTAVIGREGPEPDPEVYFETFSGARKRFWRMFGPRLRGVPIRVGKRVGPWKYIYDPETDRHELYHTGDDPLELVNRIDEHPEFLTLGRHCLDRFDHSAITARDLDPEDRRALESLGYVD